MNCIWRRVGVAALGLAILAGADWPQFRGPDSTGISPDPAPPTEWSTEKNVAWKADLPGRGLSSPIVVGDRVFVTASGGAKQDRLHVLAFERATGKTLWERQFWATGRTMSHPKTCNAAPSPASDGQRIFAFFSSNDLVCLDLDGNVLWVRGLTFDYPNVSNSLGMASSPIVVGTTLIVQAENDSQSLAFGIDVATGANRWKVDRPVVANWTSPIVWRLGPQAEPVVLLLSAPGLAAHDPFTGQRRWQYEKEGSTIPSAAPAGALVLAPGKGGLTALRPDPVSPTPEVVWQSSQLAPSTASPFVLGDKVYSLNRSGVLSCGSLEKGDRLWQLRLKGSFSGTPVSAGGLIYVVNEEGLGQVVKPGADAGEVVGQGDVEDTILCTPALADGALYFRSDKRLWKIAAQ